MLRQLALNSATKVTESLGCGIQPSDGLGLFLTVVYNSLHITDDTVGTSVLFRITTRAVFRRSSIGADGWLDSVYKSSHSHTTDANGLGAPAVARHPKHALERGTATTNNGDKNV